MTAKNISFQEVFIISPLVHFIQPPLQLGTKEQDTYVFLYEVFHATIMERILADFFHILVQFLFPMNEREIDYYHQMANIRVVSGVAKGLKNQGIRKLGNFIEIHEMLGTDTKVLCRPIKNLNSCATKFQKISCKTFHRKTCYLVAWIYVQYFIEGRLKKHFYL